MFIPGLKFSIFGVLSMAKANIRKKPARIVKKSHISPFNIYWDKKNYMFLILGAVLVVVGFLVMAIDPWDSTPALVYSPIILLIAYLIIFPLSIFYRNKASVPTEQEQEKEVAASKS